MHNTLFSLTMRDGEFIIIDENFSERFLGPGLLVYEDKTNKLTATEVLNSKADAFVRNPRKQPHYGVSSSDYWIIFTIRNQTERSQELILRLGHAAVNLLELYGIQGTTATKMTGIGTGYSFEERELDFRLPALPLKISQQTTKSFLVRMRSPKGALMSFRLLSEKSYHTTENIWQIISAFGSGYFFALLIYNLALLVFVREKLYFFYVIYLIGNMLVYLSYEGYMLRYVWRDQYTLNNFAMSVGAILTLTGMVSYIMKVLDTQLQAPAIYKAGTRLVLATLFMLPAAIIIPVEPYNKLVLVTFPILFAFSLVPILFGLKSKHPAANYMTLTFLLLLGERVFQFLGLFEVISSRDYNFLLSKLGSWIEMSMMAFLTGWKMRIYRKERDTIEEEAARQALVAAKNEARVERLKLENLKTTIQPHFLFNTLGSLKGWLHEDPHNADKLLTLLADELRLIYEISEKSMIPLRREIEVCRIHIEVMNMRLERKSRLNVEGDLTGIDIPPLILHTIIENGYSHGFANQKQSDFLIAVRKTKNSVVIEVRTPLGKRKPTVEEGMGFRYIRARLDEMFADRYEIIFSDTEDSFCSVITIRSLPENATL